MRPVLLLSLAVLVACAPTRTPATGAPGPTQTVRVSGSTGLLEVVNTSVKTVASNDVHFDTISAHIDKVWSSLPGVYAALEIPIGTFDAEDNLFGNAGMKAYRRVGKTPMTKILDCGRTQIGPSADSYEIVMSVLTKLGRIDSTNTVVTTSIQATGRPMQYGGSSTTCRTTGELERQIVLHLKARLLPP